MTQTSLTTELDTHLHASGYPVRFISPDEMAFHQARASVLRAAAMHAWLQAGFKGIASLFQSAPGLPNRSLGGKLVSAE